MAQLLVRNLDEEVKDGLRQLMVLHKRASLEEEVRELLREHVLEHLGPPRRTFKDVLAAMPFFESDPEDLFEV